MNRPLLLLATTLFISTLSPANCAPESPSPASARVSPDITTLKDNISQQQKLLKAKWTALDTLLQKVPPPEDTEFINKLGAYDGARSTPSNLWSEIDSTEGDIKNLLTDGFEDNHPRVLALRAENTRRLTQIGDLTADQFKRTDITFSPDLLKARTDFQAQLHLVLDLRHQLDHLITQGPPTSK